MISKEELMQSKSMLLKMIVLKNCLKGKEKREVYERILPEKYRNNLG